MEQVLASCRWVPFWGRRTGAYGPDGSRTGCRSAVESESGGNKAIASSCSSRRLAAENEERNGRKGQNTESAAGVDRIAD